MKGLMSGCPAAVGTNAAPTSQQRLLLQGYNEEQTQHTEVAMALDVENISLTSDDEQARRLCALAIAFSNAVSPIPSSEIHEIYYQELNDDSFRRKFSRDREKLVECGLIIRPVGNDGDQTTWQADASSFADSSSISADDALMLDILCSPLVDDPSFAHRDELRLALAKVDHAFGELTAARLSPAQREGTSALPIMLSCMAQGTFAQITYVDARGEQSERTVAPYGHFSLRGNVYLVCAQQADGAEPVMRTLRADRIQKAHATAKRFSLPEDFSVDDFVLLPFQIGPTTCTARLHPSGNADSDLLADLDRRAEVDGEGVRTVSVSDANACARWCVAAGIVPVAPAELVEAWQKVLVEASAAQAIPMPEVETSPSRAPRKRRGRRGGTNEMRELVALVGSLGKEGSSVSPAAVSARLGISLDRALLLIDLLLTACSGTGYQLPLGLSSEDGIVLAHSQGVMGRPIRLTQAEARALISALDELGFTQDDPLRADVLAAFAPSGLSEQEARQRVEASLSRDASETLEACSRAISSERMLSFAYQAGGQAPLTHRRVLPQSVRHSDDLWYLDGYDLSREAMRTFRVDRMSDVRISAAQHPISKDGASSVHAERPVEVAFHDRSLLDLLEWPKLKMLGEQGGALVTTLPYYGGLWLPRHLAACGAAAFTSDEELAALTREAAKQMLDGKSS